MALLIVFVMVAVAMSSAFLLGFIYVLGGDSRDFFATLSAWILISSAVIAKVAIWLTRSLERKWRQ